MIESSRGSKSRLAVSAETDGFTVFIELTVFMELEQDTM